MEEFHVKPRKKANYYAKRFFNAANLLIKKRQFYDAITKLNQSLAFVENGSSLVPLIYAARSKVYFEVENYENCVKNIELVKTLQATDNILTHELNDREEACRKMLKNQNIQDFFKLSHSSHKQIPFASSALEVMRNDDTFGRFIITNCDMRTGEIVVIEEPFLKIVDDFACHLRCSNCLKSNMMNLLPSQLCASNMFCSQKCLNEANEIYHENEVNMNCIEFTQRILFQALHICDNNFVKLQAVMNEANENPKLIFDFDWNDNNSRKKIEQLTAFCSLQMGPNVETSFIDELPILATIKLPKDKEIAREFLTRAARIVAVNCYSLEWRVPKCHETKSLESMEIMKIGSGILLLGSLFNHSCTPNIDRMIYDNKFIFYVKRPIQKGEQLFVNYGPSFTKMPYDNRKMSLKQNFHFICGCEACSYPENFPINFNNSLQEIKMSSSGFMLNDLIEEFYRNCSKIDKNLGKYPSPSLSSLMDRNLYILAVIAKNEPFIF